VGTLNPSAGDVSVFLLLEQTALSGAVADCGRTDLSPRYSSVGSLFGSTFRPWPPPPGLPSARA
jgi:hypothetical protein